MKTHVNIFSGFRQLLLDLGGPAEDRPVVAAIHQCGGTPDWVLFDWRYSMYPELSPHACSLCPEEVRDSLPFSTPEDSERIRLIVPESAEILHPVRGGRRMWCPFVSVVKGRVASEGSWFLARNPHNPPIFFSWGEVSQRFLEIAEFWRGYEGAPEAAQMPNPDRRPTAFEVREMLSSGR